MLWHFKVKMLNFLSNNIKIKINYYLLGKPDVEKKSKFLKLNLASQ